jgi:hypothetical protein
MKVLRMRRLALVTLIAALLGALPPLASAQRGGGHFAAPGGHGFRSGPGVAPNLVRNPGPNFAGPTFVSRHFSNSAFSNFASRYGSLAYLSEPFFGTDFYADDLYNAGYPVAAQLPVVIMQRTPGGTEAAAPVTSAPVQPLMIELQGDRYVHVSGDDRSGAEMVDRDTILSRERADAPHPDLSHANLSRVAEDLPPAVLVFRDGHREEVSNYTITDGVLYASSDFYRDGAWNRKIELSSLSLPETAKASQERGVEFRLPTSPNEVIVRP